jgi:hypothetical protein
LLGNFKEIIARLEAQKRAIDQAIAALSEFDEGDVPKSSTPTAKRSGVGVKSTKKRVMSEEGRQRIAEAQKKRWATKKRAVKKLAKTA